MAKQSIFSIFIALGLFSALIIVFSTVFGINTVPITNDDMVSPGFFNSARKWKDSVTSSENIQHLWNAAKHHGLDGDVYVHHALGRMAKPESDDSD